MTNLTRALAAVLTFLSCATFAQPADETEGEGDAPAGPKLSGYVQGRFVWDEASTHQRVTDGFTVRRARLKVEWMGKLGGGVLQVDASPKGVALRDAEARFVEPWTGKGLELSVGQMKWPFGHEVLQSSQDRELPERSRAMRAFFANERDRGARLRAKVGVVRFSGGVFDGNGIDAQGFGGVDNDRYKDVVGRVGIEAGIVTAGLSGWYGRTVEPAGGPDALPLSARTFDRNRVGADLRLRHALWSGHPTTLQLEVVRGRSYWRDRVEQYGVPAAGGYALLTQALPGKNLVAARFDVFDGRLGTADTQVHTLGFAWVHQLHEKLKLTAAYEIPLTRGPEVTEDPKDNVFTLQLQASY